MIRDHSGNRGLGKPISARLLSTLSKSLSESRTDQLLFLDEGQAFGRPSELQNCDSLLHDANTIQCLHILHIPNGFEVLKT